MKFVSIVEAENLEIDLKSEFAEAAKFGNVALGDSIIFQKKGFKYTYLPISCVYRVFRRVKSVPVRFYKSKSEIRLEYIVLCSRKKEEIAEFDLPDEKTAQLLLEEIQKKFPDIKIGKK